MLFVKGTFNRFGESRLGVFRVFPGKGASGHLAESAKAWQRIKKRAGVPDARMHDLRRTLGSWLAAQGHSLTLIGRALNQTNVSTTQIYARLDLGYCATPWKIMRI